MSFNNKDQELLIEIEKNKIDICALSETKKRGKGTDRFNNYVLVYSGKDKADRATSGVGLLLHDRYEENIEKINYVNDRVLSVSLKFDNKRLHIISVYAPDINKPPEETIDFYRKLQEEIDNFPINDKVIIMGDFNARIGNSVINGIKQRFNEDTINENGENLVDFCANNELRINNTFYMHKQQHKYTWHNTRGQQSTIDYIITNRSFHPSQILDVRALSAGNIGTDHNLILCKVRLTLKHSKAKNPEFVERINIESMSIPSTRQLYENRLKQKLLNNPVNSEDSVQSAWDKLEKNITAATHEAVGKRRVNIHAKHNNKPWFTEEIKLLAAEKRQAYLKYRSLKSAEEYERYKLIRNDVNSRIRQIKSDFWNRFSKDMEYDLYGGQKKMWNFLRNRKKPVNEYTQNVSITPEVWISHFTSLYTSTSSTIEIQSTVSEAGLFLVNYQLVENALKSLKNRKSPGKNKIPNECLKYGGAELVSELVKFFNKVLQLGEIPANWHTSVTIPIFKKGSKANPANYRGITLLDTIQKTLTKIIGEELISKIGMCEEQYGFRKNRSTIDAIFIIRQLKEKSIEFNKPMFMCFVDLCQAFDRIQLNDVIEILKQHNIQNNIISIIAKLNADNKTQIKINGTLTDEVPISSGIRQGDSLSPTLFNMIMNIIITEIKRKNIGYRLGNQLFSIICYADDAVLLAENEDDLQRLLHAFELAAARLNMLISAEKTKSLVISRDPIRCKLVANNKSIEQVMTFRYLGVEISSHQNIAHEVRTQVNKAHAISGCLRDVIWRNKVMLLENKVRIYKTCVRPISTYAVETRAETSKTKQILRVAEMKTLRSIAGHSLRDRITNESIRDECKIIDIVRWCRQRRREWRDHVERMPASSLVKMAKDVRPAAKRPVGRPPKRWYESWSSTSQNS